MQSPGLAGAAAAATPGVLAGRCRCIGVANYAITLPLDGRANGCFIRRASDGDRPAREIDLGARSQALDSLRNRTLAVAAGHSFNDELHQGFSWTRHDAGGCQHPVSPHGKVKANPTAVKPPAWSDVSAKMVPHYEATGDLPKVDRTIAG